MITCQIELFYLYNETTIFLPYSRNGSCSYPWDDSKQIALYCCSIYSIFLTVPPLSKGLVLHEVLPRVWFYITISNTILFWLVALIFATARIVMRNNKYVNLSLCIRTCCYK